MLDKEQIKEWKYNPVTIEFFKHLEGVKQEFRSASRYSPLTSIGGNTTATTAEYCAMQNAHVQGCVDAVQSIIDLELEEVL